MAGVDEVDSEMRTAREGERERERERKNEWRGGGARGWELRIEKKLSLRIKLVVETFSPLLFLCCRYAH